MARFRIYQWQAAVAVTALFGLALFPSLGLAQQGQSGGDQGGPQAQSQKDKAQSQNEKGQGKNAKGPDKAAPSKPSGPRPGAPAGSATNAGQPRAQVGPTTPSQPSAQTRRPRPSTIPTVAPPAQTQRPSAVTPHRAVTAPRQAQPAVVTPGAVRAPVTPRGPGPTVVRPLRPSRALAGLPPAVKTPAPEPVNRQALTRQVPAATFRGPQAERKVVAITPEAHRRGVQQLNGWVKQQNAQPAESGRPTQDWIGNTIPSNTRRLGPSSFRQMNTNYTRISLVFGAPSHEYMVLPRTTLYAGYYGQQDGFYGYQNYGHPNSVSVSLFYPYYFSQPTWYAFNYPGFYPSVYSMYGWSPGWVYPDRVYCQPSDHVYTPAPYQPGLQLDVAGQGRALDDIRQAWLDDDPTLFSAHLTDQTDIRVYFNSKYSYTSSTDDYYAMTADAMSTTRSSSIDFNDPVWISSNEVFYAGHQVFTDLDGASRDLHLSYRLRKLGSEWYIVAFGTSPDPILTHYKDFRNG